MKDFGECVTHHHACDCREAQWERMWKTLEGIIGKTVHCPTPDCPCDKALKDIRETARKTLEWKG